MNMLSRCTNRITLLCSQRLRWSSSNSYRNPYAGSQNSRPPFPNYTFHILGVAGVAGGLFYWANLKPVEITGRKRFIIVSPEFERRLGEQAYKQILAQEARNILPKTHPLSKKISDVGARIAKVSGLTDTKWEFTVIDSPMLNAFVLPGGKVCVYTGLFKAMPDDDSIATVLAHEVGHVVARHAGERVSISGLGTILLLVVRMFIDIPINLDFLYQAAFELPKSRKMELEADYIGLKLMTRACFRPSEAPKVFARLAELNKGSNMVPFLSTHPSDSTRIRNFGKFMDKATADYETRCQRQVNQFFSAVQRAPEPVVDMDWGMENQDPWAVPSDDKLWK